jgi:hypothetical protein
MRLAIETSGGFHPDGRAFLTLGADGTVKLRDAVTGAVSSRLMIANSPAICAAFRATALCVTVGEKPYRSQPGSRSTAWSGVALRMSLGSLTDASNALVLPPLDRAMWRPSSWWHFEPDARTLDTFKLEFFDLLKEIINLHSPIGYVNS